MNRSTMYGAIVDIELGTNNRVNHAEDTESIVLISRVVNILFRVRISRKFTGMNNLSTDNARVFRITKRKLQFNIRVFVLIKTGVVIGNGTDCILSENANFDQLIKWTFARIKDTWKKCNYCENYTKQRRKYQLLMIGSENT